MRPEDYPPQEPFSAFAMPYVEEVTRRSEPVTPTADVRYGDDPYQSIAVHAAAAPTGDVFAFVHGGGWTSGYKEQMNFMAPGFTAAGFQCQSDPPYYHRCPALSDRLRYGGFPAPPGPGGTDGSGTEGSRGGARYDRIRGP